MKVNIHYAKTHLSKLLERVQLGEEIVITKAGKPVATLVPIPDVPRCRTLGSAKGMFQLSDDFDAPLPPEIENGFWK